MPLPDGFQAIDFDDYHRVQLPALLDDGRAEYVGRAAAALGSIAIRLREGAAYTYRPLRDGIDISAGEADAATVLELDVDSWQGLVHELEAPAGLLYAGRVRCVRGNAVDFMAWESALRALYNGRPPYDTQRLDLRDSAGEPLDPQRTFTLAEARAEMAHFLRVVGYLFVRDVFSADEVRQLLREAGELRHEARKGDKLSWWGKNAAGAEVLCRVTRGVAKPHLAALRDDARLLALKDLADEPLVYRRGEGEGVTVIYKHPNMVEGLGDLPWHRDCGMGGHAVMCPVLIASLYLTEASPESGELAMLPGSRLAAFGAHDPLRRDDLPSAHFHARPGDVSLHYSDTVHAAPPPTAGERDSYRVSAVVGFARPDARHHRGERSYNDVLHQRGDGQVEHLVDVARRL
jgi:Phytanoyl-CoA dioxygenase (PhyH)